MNKISAKIINFVTNKYILCVLFLLCLVITFSVEKLNSGILSIITGYIAGYIIYVLTSLLPVYMKNKSVNKQAMKRITLVYSKSMYILLLMCKSCCSKEEWNSIFCQNDDDINCMNNDFYKFMANFNINDEAYSLLRTKENNDKLRWDEYLTIEFSKLYNDLDEIIIKHHLYLNDETLTLIIELKDSLIFDLLLGTGSSSLMVIIGEDGYEYYDNYSLAKLMEIKNTLYGCVFNGEYNILENYIQKLIPLHKILNKYKERFGLEQYHKDYAISKLKNEKVGKYKS